MTTPTKKSEPIENLIDFLLPGECTRRGSINSNSCSWCGGIASGFRDKLSKKEYAISGLCQICQDKIFGE